MADAQNSGMGTTLNLKCFRFVKWWMVF